jgi:hypothetical protein
MNYPINKLDSTLPELFNMLKTVERALKKEKGLVLLVWSSRISKKKEKKNKGVVSQVNKPTRGIKKHKGICHHCGKEGHWRRNCKEYLATMKANKLNETYTSGTKKKKVED